MPISRRHFNSTRRTHACTSRSLLNLLFKHYDDVLRMTADGLKLAPKNADLHFLQGAAYSQLGNRQQAEASYQRAIKLNPDLANSRGEFYK